MKQITLYHRASSGGVKVWKARLNGDLIVVSWGLEGCKMLEAAKPQQAKGKPGTKTYKDSTHVANEEFDRLVKKKKDEGYSENRADIVDDVNVGRLCDGTVCEDPETLASMSRPRAGLDFDNPPRSFAPSKPLADIDQAKLQKLEAAGDLLLQRKEDGMRHFIFFGYKRIQIFSRRMENASGQFQEFIAKLEPYREALAGTVLDTEFTVKKPDGSDDFAAVASVCRAGDAKAQERLRFMNNWSFLVFDALYIQGAPVFGRAYRERHALLAAIVSKLQDAVGPQVRAVENLDITVADWKDVVRTNKWEGLVAWEASKPTVVQLNGKPKRTNCAKLKPLHEDDFVATAYELGEGSNSDKVGALFISQYINGTLTPVGKVGTGLTTRQRLEALRWTYPCVVQCEYSERTPDGSLRFPVFVRVRPDKPIEECAYEPEKD